MTQAAVVVDHLVPMVGVDEVIKSRKPQDNLPHHLEKDLGVGQIGPRFGPLLPPVKEHPWVFVITQPADVVDQLVPMVLMMSSSPGNPKTTTLIIWKRTLAWDKFGQDLAHCSPQ